jgi:hypothetical protein
MPAKDANAHKRLYYISPANRDALLKRSHPKSGGKDINPALNSWLQRYAGMCENAMRRVWSALPEQQDRDFIRFVLMGTATDDLTVAESPISYLQGIEEAMAEYEPGEEPFTPTLRIALRGFGPLEAIALVDWVEQEKAKK